jgi:hypothetical protein
MIGVLCAKENKNFAPLLDRLFHVFLCHIFFHLTANYPLYMKYTWALGVLHCPFDQEPHTFALFPLASLLYCGGPFVLFFLLGFNQAVL